MSASSHSGGGLPGRLRIAAGALLLGTFVELGATQAGAPELLRTPGYEAPVRGEPGELMQIFGNGLEASDRVVYEIADSDRIPKNHPAVIPAQSSAVLGTLTVVHTANPPYVIAVRLPLEMHPGRTYRIWVVNPKGEWSEPLSINDVRPMWITPPYAYTSAKLPGLDRRVRVVGRNLAPRVGAPIAIKLSGPRSYELVASSSAVRDAEAPDPPDALLQDYVAEAPLPSRLPAGNYSISVRRGEEAWTEVSGQKLEVRPDPVPAPAFSIDDPRYGTCHPDDQQDDSGCFIKAIDAATRAGTGTIVIPRGTWDVVVPSLPDARSGFVLPPNVRLRATSGRDSVIMRHGASQRRGALFTLMGGNSIEGITFTDAEPYRSIDDTRAVILMGPAWNGAGQNGSDATIDDVVISDNAFRHVGRAIADSGRSIRRLLITRNEFGAYDNALYMTGNRYLVDTHFRIDDAVVRFNRFTPGSYLDVRAGGGGTIASQLGGSHRLDFSSNIADGTSTEGLQSPGDPKGWGAVFFWNVGSSHEQVLVAQNRITCPGDKAGNGEAITYDDNGNTSGFNGAPWVAASGGDWVAVAAPLLEKQFGVHVPVETYYLGHWTQVVQGPGIGQTRKIVGYTRDRDGALVTLRVSPPWDIRPRPGQSRIGVGQQYWQVYTVANDIDQTSPTCRKANLSGPRGGVIAQWAHTADTVIAGNKQKDTSGILLQHIYSATTPSCPACNQTVAMQTADEIRENLIDGEYSWSSDCSDSGIAILFGASATPESPPPVLSFGLTIDRNSIVHADGYKSGAIDVTASWSDGPPPHNWPFVQSALISTNLIRDISGALPTQSCRRPMSSRTGIRLAASEHVRDVVLAGNVCERVDSPLEDGGKNTERICQPGQANICGCDFR